MDGLLGGGLGGVITLFILILAVLWFLLPFAIFGTKDKLSELIEESKKTNEQLIALRSEIAVIKNQETDSDDSISISATR